VMAMANTPSLNASSRPVSPAATVRAGPPLRRGPRGQEEGQRVPGSLETFLRLPKVCYQTSGWSGLAEEGARGDHSRQACCVD
jgi:hypothetical protein